jgi:hypothetical protein
LQYASVENFVGLHSSLSHLFRFSLSYLVVILPRTSFLFPRRKTFLIVRRCAPRIFERAACTPLTDGFLKSPILVNDGTPPFQRSSLLSPPSSLEIQATPKQEGSSTVVVIGSVLGLLVLLAIVAFIIFVVTRRSKEDDSSIEAEPDESHELETNQVTVEFDEWSAAVSEVADSASGEFDESFGFADSGETTVDGSIWARK